MRVLGVDFGFARIGIAVGESEVAIATARPALQASGTLRRDASTIAHLAKEEEADMVVVGVPEYGENGRQARICRKLGEEIVALGWKVDYVDESLTSVTAQNQLREHDLTAAQRRKKVDAAAACLILERFFAENL